MQKLTVQRNFLKLDDEATWASCALLPFIAFDCDRMYNLYVSQIEPLPFKSKIEDIGAA